MCSSCQRRRNNSRREWVPITRRDQLIGYTCPDCPTASEPIRRIETPSGRVRFRAVVDTTPPGAAQRRQATRTFQTLDEAREFVIEVRSNIDNAQVLFVPQSVRDVCERWLASRRDVRQVTVDGYRAVLVPILRRIGDDDVRTIGVTELDALTEWLATEGGRRGGPLGARTVRAALTALAQAFDFALREELITRNPVRLVRRPRLRKRAGKDLEHWQPAELLKFRDYSDSDSLAGAWRLTLSGLTRADVLGLRWSDVDLERGTVAVSQGRVALHRGDHTDEPKSAQRVRTVPVEAIHRGTVALLRSLKAAQAADRLQAGTAYTETGYLVVDALGAPLRPESYSDKFRTLCIAAGVASINLHSVRHSLAFWLHQLGVAPADAAALLGHTVEVHLSAYLPHSGGAGIATAAAALGSAATASG